MHEEQLHRPVPPGLPRLDPLRPVVAWLIIWQITDLLGRWRGLLDPNHLGFVAEPQQPSG